MKGRGDNPSECALINSLRITKNMENVCVQLFTKKYIQVEIKLFSNAKSKENCTQSIVCACAAVCKRENPYIMPKLTKNCT